MSATQAWPNVAEVLCQSKRNFRSYSIFGDDRFFCVILYIVPGSGRYWGPVRTLSFSVIRPEIDGRILQLQRW